jgi:hypothetical protein
VAEVLFKVTPVTLIPGTPLHPSMTAKAQIIAIVNFRLDFIFPSQYVSIHPDGLFHLVDRETSSDHVNYFDFRQNLMIQRLIEK